MANSWQLSAQCDWRAWDTAVYHDQCRGARKVLAAGRCIDYAGSKSVSTNHESCHAPLVSAIIQLGGEAANGTRLPWTASAHLPDRIYRRMHSASSGARSLALVCSPKGAPETSGPSQQRAAGSGPGGAINQSIAAGVAAFEIPPSSASAFPAPTDCAIRRTARPRKHRTGLQPALTPVLSLISKKAQLYARSCRTSGASIACSNRANAHRVRN